MLNPNERLLVLRGISHHGLIVGQTNEQVKRADLIATDQAQGAGTARRRSLRPSPAGQ
jgi:hypothetical protein